MKSKPYASKRVNDVVVEEVIKGRDGQAVVVGVDVGKLELSVVARWGENRVHALNSSYSSGEGLIKSSGDANDGIDVAQFMEDFYVQVAVSYPGFHQEVLLPVARSA